MAEPDRAPAIVFDLFKAAVLQLVIEGSFGRIIALVVLPDDCYQGVAGLAGAGAERGRWSVQRVAVDDTAGWMRACRDADLIWL